MQAICIVGVEADFDQGGSDPHVNFSTDDWRRTATSHRRRSGDVSVDRAGWGSSVSVALRSSTGPLAQADQFIPG